MESSPSLWAVAVVQPPGESRLLVVERNGVVRPIGRNGRPGAAWLDIRGRVGADGLEQGLLGMAFAPDFAASGRVYVNYTNTRGDTRVVEFRTRSGARAVSTRTARVVLAQPQPFANHNGGALQFGPDRMLYVSLGDGGGQGVGQVGGVLLGDHLEGLGVEQAQAGHELGPVGGDGEDGGAFVHLAGAQDGPGVDAVDEQRAVGGGGGGEAGHTQAYH